MARAGLNRLSPRATWIVVLAANAPDVDVVSALASAHTYLRWHRDFTHSLLMSPVIALLPVFAVRAFKRGAGLWRAEWIAAWVGVLSHVLLDYLNIYGIRILWPFSRNWYRLDLVPVIDPWFWAALALALAAPALSRLVGSEIGEQRRGKTRYGFGAAVAALVFLTVYTGARAVWHARAIAELNSRTYEGAAPRQVAALPNVFWPLSWRGLIVQPDEYGLVPVDLLQEFNPLATDYLQRNPPTPATEAASRSAPFQGFLQFVQYPYWTETPAPEPEGAAVVKLYDLRFGNPRAPGFVATAVVGPGGDVLSSRFTFGEARPR